jgi:hypothetical protein
MPGRRVSRRKLLVLGGSALALRPAHLGGPAFAQGTPEPEISDALTTEILFEEAEPGSLRVPKTVIKPFWYQKPEGERPSPNWPTDNVSFDFAHLTSQPNSEEPFELSAGVLEKLLALNSAQRNAQSPKLLFGVRGCMLVNGEQTTFAKGHMVRATRPNHVDAKCLIGVWDTTAGTLAVFKASTVPCADLMEKQIEGVLGCNMLPTGFHQYRVGPHRGANQPGAFRQQTSLWVHRTKKKMLYAANDDGNEWDDLNGDLPFDNIHAAMLSSRKTPPFFSSAGCQVVAGAYSGHTPTGPWAKFREAAGLVHPPQVVNQSTGESRDDGRHFDYFLTTGKDAQLMTAGAANAVRALRFGSSGQGVSDLQEKLAALPAGKGVNKTGVFDRATLGGVIRWQVENKIVPSGIIVAETAAKFGLNWT